MSISIKYEIDGRQVGKQQFFDGLEGQMRKIALDTVIEQVSEVTCAEHGQRAEVSQVTQTSDGFSFQLTGCCDDLVERAEANVG
jgi:hypothetical protein